MEAAPDPGNLPSFFGGLSGDLVNRILSYCTPAITQLMTLFAVVVGVGLVVAITVFIVRKIG